MGSIFFFCLCLKLLELSSIKIKSLKNSIYHKNTFSSLEPGNYVAMEISISHSLVSPKYSATRNNNIGTCKTSCSVEYRLVMMSKESTLNPQLDAQLSKIENQAENIF